MATRPAEIEEAARGRFVRWDTRLWREVVDGPADQLARGLDAAGPAAEGAALLDSYLRLCCEAVGLGYLYPASAGRESFFTLAFGRLAPRLLPALAPEKRAAALAGLWNLGENLEGAPVWLARVFHRLASGWSTLADLEGVVGEVERQATGEPETRLAEPARVVWTRPADEDRHFLPGRMHFVAPTVLCVHDRLRREASQGVWLTDGGGEPLLLGALGCGVTPGPAPAAGARWKRLVKEDPRFAEPHTAVANAWRAAVTLAASQRVVILLP